MTDALTAAARGEAARRVPGDSRLAHATPDMLVDIAEWAHAHLAEAAALDAGARAWMESDGIDWDGVDENERDNYRTIARPVVDAVLAAAREARS